jgi:hypothetical protein
MVDDLNRLIPSVFSKREDIFSFLEEFLVL